MPALFIFMKRVPGVMASLQGEELWTPGVPENRNLCVALSRGPSFLLPQTPPRVRDARGTGRLQRHRIKCRAFHWGGCSVRAGWARLPRTHPAPSWAPTPGCFARRVSVLSVAATQQQQGAGEREMALTPWTKTLVPRATSELFTFYSNNATTPAFISCSTSALPFDF